RALGFTPDGRALAVVTPKHLAFLPLDGGAERQMKAPPVSAEFFAITPDGRPVVSSWARGAGPLDCHFFVGDPAANQWTENARRPAARLRHARGPGHRRDGAPAAAARRTRAVARRRRPDRPDCGPPTPRRRPPRSVDSPARPRHRRDAGGPLRPPPAGAPPRLL